MIRFIQKRSFLTVAFCFLAALIFFGCNLLGGSDDKDTPPPPTESHGFYTITIANSWAGLNLDSTYTITWVPSTSAEGGNVRISLYQDDAFKANITTSISNSGTYIWNLTSLPYISKYKVGSGSHYRLKIMSSTDSTKWDYSPLFSITSNYSGTLTVTSPTDSTVALLDSSLSIRWAGSVLPTSSIGIQLYQDTSLVSTITSSATSSGFYTWQNVTTLSGSGSNYRIRVFSIANPSITSFSRPFRINSIYNGSFTIPAIASNDTLVAGNTEYINWSVSGNPGTSVSVSLYQDSTFIEYIDSYVTISQSNNSIFWDVPDGILTGSKYRIKITSLDDQGIYAYSNYFSISGISPDAYENDDSLKVAKSIPVDGTVQHRSLSVLDIDWIRFQSTLGKKYIVSFSSNNSVTATLYDSVRTLGYSSQSGTSFQMILQPTYTGKYHLRVSSYYYGEYTVAIKEFDSSQITAQTSFSSPDSNSIWASNSSYSITWTPDSLFYGNYVNLYLYQDSTLISNIVSSKSNTGYYSWTVPTSIYTSSKYRIRIQSYSNSQIFSYSPYFTISGLTPDAYEPDNYRTSAKTLTVSSIPQERTIASTDDDWIKISTKAGKRYLATFNSKVSIYVYSYDSIGNSIGISSSGTQFTHILTPTRAGNYYLSIESSYSNGAYTVSLAEMDTASGGLPTHFSAPDSSSIWAAGTSYNINWSPDSMYYGSYVTLALYRDNSLVQSISSSASNSGSVLWSIPAGTATYNRYRIRISNYSNSQVYGYSPYFTISGVNPDLFEPDNQRSTAKAISADGTIQNRNVTYNDTDWVQFDAVLGKTYFASVRSSSTVYAYMMDSTGYSLNSQSGTSLSIALTPTRSGKYYLRLVNNSSLSTGTYSVSIIAQTSSKYGLAINMTTPDSSSIWLAGSYNTVTWTPDTLLFGRYIDLELYRDTVYVQSLSTYLNNSGFYSVSIPTGMMSGSNYRIRISNYNNKLVYGNSAAFSISGIAPDLYESNDKISDAKTFPLNQATKQSLSLALGDKDWFKFTCKPQILYMIQTTSSPNTLTTTLRLYQSQGTSLIATGTRATYDSVNSITWVCPTAGEYHALVEPYSSSYYGPYSFEIKEVDPTSYKFSVTSPTALTKAQVDQSITITWTDPMLLKGQADIFLYNTEGIVQTIAANVTNNGSYYWTIPATLSARSGYYIRIISRINSSINGSSATFSIGL